MIQKLTRDALEHRLEQTEAERDRYAVDKWVAQHRIRELELRNLARGLALAAWLHLVSWRCEGCCGLCPFCDEDYDQALCRADPEERCVDADESPPEWCPIENFGPLLVHRGRLGRGGV